MRLTGYGIKIVWPILRTEMLIYHLNAKLEMKLFLANHKSIDLLAILQKSLDRALSLCNSISEVRLSAVRASITIVHIRTF